MAGISFELRKALKKDSLSSILKAFGYSLVLSSGPYIISILSLILVHFISSNIVKNDSVLTQFQVSITYLIAFSLIYTGLSQLVFTRYTADRLFERDYSRILPNFNGILILNMVPAFFFSFLFSLIFLSKETDYLFCILFSSTFTILTGLWIVNIVLTSLKSYKFILLSFLIGYTLFVLLSYLFANKGLNALMGSYFVGQTVLFLMLLFYFTYLNYSDKIVEFDFINKDRIYISLVFTGFFYNLGLWVDKFVFWFNNLTGAQVLGPLRYSIVYDIPIFLAYLAIAPGMAIFFLKLEGEFASYYERYYEAVVSGLNLQKIYELGDEMIYSARAVIFDTIRIQGIFNIIIVLFDRFLFNMFNIPIIYIPLFHVLLFGTYLQLIMLSLFSMFFYFDRRKEALILAISFTIFNFTLSILSVHLGPYFYGYGFTVSIFITIIISIIKLRRFLNDIHYYTFMLR